MKTTEILADKQLQRLTDFAAIAIIAIGAASLVGWVFDIPLLTSTKQGWSSIKINTIIAFICSGIALLSACRKGAWHCIINKASAVMVLLIGTATTAEYAFAIDLGIDQLFIVDNTTSGTGSPGRMSPFAAVNFILIGISLLLLQLKSTSVSLLINCFCLTTLTIGLLMFNAYLYGIDKLYQAWGFTHMAFIACVLYIVLSIAIMGASSGGGFLSLFIRNTKASKIALKQLLTFFFLLIFISWLRVQGQNYGLFPVEVGVSLSVVTSLLIVSVVLWQGASVINKAEFKLSELNKEILEKNKLLQQEVIVRKKAEEEVRALNSLLEKKVQDRTEQLQQANKELEAFSYSVSHDLRAPLRAVNGYAQMLLEDYETVLDAEGKRLLNTIIQNGKMMGRLIDDLLKFSRLGRLEFVQDAVDMKQLVCECVNELTQDQPERKAQIKIGELPQCRGDRQMLKQVWQNLIDNALKYTSKVAAPVIEIACTDKADSLEYYIKDNGAGFDMQYADKLFGVFQRLHRSEEFEGSGVGLALVHRITIKHNGNIRAEAQPCKGATFYLSIPKEAKHA